MLTEFGGIAFSRDIAQHLGLLAGARSRRSSRKRYLHLLRVVRALPVLAGFCYTQFADTYQEANGLLYADRTPKIPHGADRAGHARPRAPSATSRSSGSGASG